MPHRRAGPDPGRHWAEYGGVHGTDHAGRKERAGMIRRCIIWRNKYADGTRLRQIVARANDA